MPSRFGDFEVVSFRQTDGILIADVAIIHGSVRSATYLPTRVHSECLTGDVFGSVRCDCRDQLEMALERISRAPRGVLLYMRQEGRGIGIADKIRAYRLQDGGMDTVEANLHLGFEDDLRTYELAAAMLHTLDVRSIVLHTNNPRKVKGLVDHGVEVMDRVPLIAEPRAENAKYVQTKRRKSGHLDEQSS
ncbi:MAG: GTP cyclohydrolase II [bacterium]|nr:GTP cyclohydrolase II [bacterium]